MPVEWPQEQGDPPRILIAPSPPRAKAPAPGIGDRVLARLSRGGAEPAPVARVIKVLEKKPIAVLGVVRHGANGSRIEPIDKKSKELILDPADAAKAKDGDLVTLNVTSSGRFGLDRARITEVLGSVSSEKAVSMIAIYAHGIPHIFPNDVLAEAEAASPAPLRDREDWRNEPLLTIDPPDAKDHDDAVMAVPDPDPKNPGGTIVTVAIADVAWYVRPGHGARSRSAEARQLGLFPGSRRADAARAHLQRPVLAPRRRGPPGAGRAHGVLRRRPQDQPSLPPHHDALGGKALLSEGAGRFRRKPRRPDLKT